MFDWSQYSSDTFFTKKEVAEILNIGTVALEKRVRAGTFPPGTAFKKNGRKYWKAGSLVKWFAARERRPA